MAQESTTVTIWRFIARYLKENGSAPTLREISEGCYLSVAAVSRHLARLEERGVLELRPNVARGIKLVEPPPPH